MKVIQVIPTLNLAGAERMCENLSIELKRQGIEVVVVSLFSCHTAISYKLEREGIKVIFLNKKPGLDLKIIMVLTKIIKSERPDVLHTHIHAIQYAIPAAILAGVKKRVHTVHSVADREATPRKQKINYFFYHKCNVIPVALSNEVKETIIARYNLPDNQIPVINNAVDLNKCIKKIEYSSSGSNIVFLHIGRFNEVKNHKMLIEAFKAVHDKWEKTKLQLIGEGNLESEVKDLIDNLGLNDCVELLGLIDNVFPYLNNADVFVLPSIYEGMPMTLIEAMGTGLPIIASNIGGIPTMIQSNIEGLLIQLNIEELVSAMMQMQDTHLRMKFGINAYNKAHNVFTVENMAKKYIDIYHEKFEG